MNKTSNRFLKALFGFSDIMILSVCWVFCSLPLVTLGASTAALYDAVTRCVCGEEERAVSCFIRGLKKHFVATLPIALIALVLVRLFYWAYGMFYLMALQGSTLGWVLLIADLLCLCVPLAIWLVSVPARVQMEYTAKELLVEAPRLAFRKFKITVLITAVVLVAVLLTSRVYVFFLVSPGLAALVIALQEDGLFDRGKRKIRKIEGR